MMKLKKILGVAMLGVTIVTASLPVYAETTSYYFNLSVNKSDISKRTEKAGGSNYETKFYVTPTLFNKTVRYHACSKKLSTNAQESVDINLTKSMLNKGQKGNYYVTPTAGAYYYLYGTYDAAASSGSGLYVEGRYTP